MPIVRLLPAVAMALVLAGLPAQGTLIQVTAATEAALTAAIQSANALVFQTSAANPVVIEFANSLIGQTIALTQAPPILVSDHATVRVAGAAPGARVTIDATNAPTAFRLSGRHATVRNVRFQNAGAPGSQQDVFSAYGADDLDVRYCDFDAATGNGLWLIGLLGASVQDCGFQLSAGGLVTTSGTSNVTVAGCTFSHNARAIVVHGGNAMHVTTSTFDANGNAIDLLPTCVDTTVGPGNLIKNTTTMPGLVAVAAVGLTIAGNQWNDNVHAAIALSDGCSGTAIRDNNLLRNGLPAEYQVTVRDAVDVAIEGIVCNDGGAGIYGSGTVGLTVDSSATTQTSVAQNRDAGLTLLQCRNVAIRHVTLTGNLTQVASSQLSLLSCEDADVVDADVLAATGPGRVGLRIDGCNRVRVGAGTAVLDNGGSGVLVNTSTDVVLGIWSGVVGALQARGPNSLQIVDSTRVRVAGTAGSPCSLQAGTAATAIAVSVSGGSAITCGPEVDVDGALSATIGMQVANCSAALIDGLTFHGHAGIGFKAVGVSGLKVRNCAVTGGAGAQFGAAQGILLNPGCDGAEVLANLVEHHQGSAFEVVGSNGVWIGPGNRAVGNNGDGFFVQDQGPTPATRQVVIQSVVAIGTGGGAQNGLRFVNMRADVTNATVTQHGTGVLLQLGSDADLVNVISWGNNLDRNRDGASTGRWFSGIRTTTAGVSGPGVWSDQDMLVGANPQFVAVATGDVRLLAGSPAIDSGEHFTPPGSHLACVDAALQPRIHGGVVDRGGYEYDGSAASNSLELGGPWLRDPSQNLLTLTIQPGPTLANAVFLLSLTGSGTGPGYTAPTLAVLPIQPDLFTGALLSLPGICLGILDTNGSATRALPILPELLPFLPESTWVASFLATPTPTNPVIVRFLQ